MRVALAQRLFGVEIPLTERVQAWSDALLAMDAVKTSVVADFEEVFMNFLKAQNSYLLTTV